MRLVEQQIALAPQDMDVRVWRARALAWSGKLQEAEKEYVEIPRVSWTDADNWLGLASVYLREGKLSDAQRAITTAEQLDPKRSDIHAARARILRAEGQRKEAQSEFQSALHLEPESTEAREGLVSVRRGAQHELRLGQDRDMLFRPRYGRIGCFALPYLWLFELLAPIMETVGIATIILAASLGVLSREFFLQFMIFGYAFATVISIGSVLQEEITYKRYNDWKDVVRLVGYCFIEHFPYRQLHMIWRLQGLWQYLRGDHEWKPLKRKGLALARA